MHTGSREERDFIELPSSPVDSLYVSVDQSNRNEVQYNLTIPRSIKHLFKQSKFKIKYSIGIPDVPESVLVVPAVMLVAPVAWLADVDISVRAIDDDFLTALNEVQAGYAELYPECGFDSDASIHADSVVKNERHGGGSALLYSGGVDSSSSFVTHYDEAPTLLTIKDWSMSNDRWERVAERNSEFARSHGTGWEYIESNLGEVLNRRLCNTRLIPSINRNWWGAVQFGTSYMAVTAPLTYAMSIDVLYQGADLTTYPSFPTAQPCYVEPLAWAGTRCEIDGSEFTRQERANNVMDFVGDETDDWFINVCDFHAPDNCGKCEMCYRTMLNLIAAGGDPRDFDFPISSVTFEEIQQFIESDGLERGSAASYFWDEIQEEMVADPDINLEGLSDFASWFVTIDLENYTVDPSRDFKTRVYRKLPQPVDYWAVVAYRRFNQSRFDLNWF